MMNLFRKKTHFFSNWEKHTNNKISFSPENGVINGISLGDHVQKLSWLGQPIRFTAQAKDQYTLEYNNLVLESAKSTLTYIGCSFGETIITNANGQLIIKSMPLSELIEIMGAPSGDDLDDVEDVILTYKFGKVCVEFEFGKTQELLRINSFIL